MKKLFKQLTIFAIVAGIATVIGADAFATSNSYTATQSLKEDFVGNLSGTAGTTAGLLVSLVGLYMWIWNQASWGIVVAIGGALITAFPGIFDSIAEGASNAFQKTTNNATVNSVGSSVKK